MTENQQSNGLEYSPRAVKVSVQNSPPQPQHQRSGSAFSPALQHALEDGSTIPSRESLERNRMQDAATRETPTNGPRYGSPAGTASPSRLRPHSTISDQEGYQAATGPHGEVSGEEFLDLEEGDNSDEVESPPPRTSTTSHQHKDFLRNKHINFRLDTPDLESSNGHEPKSRSSAAMSPPAIPQSSYYTGPPGIGAAYGTDPTGELGVHHPREILRIERDYSSGELPQFHPIFPLELEGRITPTQFQQTINDINEILISAHDTRASFLENTVATCTLYLSMLFVKTHYETEMSRLRELIEHKNVELYQPQGLRIKWPRDSAFLFLEIEYY